MTVSYPQGRPSVQVSSPNERDHRRQIAQGVNRALSGQINATLFVTLTANASSTVVTDSRVSGGTYAGAMPQTPHAAAEIAAGTMSIVCTNGSMTISHANNAETDRTFTMALIG